MKIQIKRAYEKPDSGDGVRMLIDRLWPRGVSKEEIKIEKWMKEISPSLELIKWFGHDPEKWQGFKRKYKKQLKYKNEFIKELKQISRTGTLTLVYSAKDEKHNNAVVLKEFLEG